MIKISGLAILLTLSLLGGQRVLCQNVILDSFLKRSLFVESATSEKESTIKLDFGLIFPPIPMGEIPPNIPRDGSVLEDIRNQFKLALALDTIYYPGGLIFPTSRTVSSVVELVQDDAYTQDEIPKLSCCPDKIDGFTFNVRSSRNFDFNTELIRQSLVYQSYKRMVPDGSDEEYLLTTLWPRKALEQEQEKGWEKVSLELEFYATVENKKVVKLGKRTGDAIRLGSYVIDAKVKRLHVLRPWLNQSIFGSQAWCGRQFLSKASLSSGNGSGPGALESLPVSLLIAKDMDVSIELEGERLKKLSSRAGLELDNKESVSADLALLGAWLTPLPELPACNRGESK